MGIALIICMTNRPLSIHQRETSIMPARFPIYRTDNCSTNCDGSVNCDANENVVTREKLLGMLVVLLLITLAVVMTSS